MSSVIGYGVAARPRPRRPFDERSGSCSGRGAIVVPRGALRSGKPISGVTASSGAPPSAPFSGSMTMMLPDVRPWWSVAVATTLWEPPIARGSAIMQGPTE